MAEQLDLLDVAVRCPVCGTALNQPQHAGRPRRWCSDACRMKQQRGRSEIPVAPDTAPPVSSAPVAPQPIAAAGPTDAVVATDVKVVQDGQPERVDLRSPYTSEEWTAIVAALRAERARRKVEHLPRTDQMTVVDQVLISMRRPS